MLQGFNSEFNKNLKNHLIAANGNFAGQEVSTTSPKESIKSSHSKILRRKKSNYKHVPHCEKPPQVVAKRNARERKRVQAVNQAFIQLRKAIPIESKVKEIVI